MQDIKNKIIRHGVPGKYDQSPQGTECRVVSYKTNHCDIYLQRSADEDNPDWVLLEENALLDLEENESSLDKIRANTYEDV